MRLFLTLIHYSSLYDLRHLNLLTVGHLHVLAVCCSQPDVLHRPIARVFYGPCRAALRCDVDPLYVDDWLCGQTARRENLLRAHGIHVLNRDVAKFAEAAFGRRDRSVHNDPVRRNVLHIFRYRRVAVARIPIERKGERQRNVLHLQVAYQYVFHEPSARLSGLEAYALARAHAAIVIGDDFAYAARSLASEGEHAAAATYEVVTDDDIFSRAVDAKAIGVAPCLQADVVVIIVNVAIFDQNVAGRVYVNAIRARTSVVAYLHAVHGDVVRIDYLYGPEA